MLPVRCERSLTSRSRIQALAVTAIRAAMSANETTYRRVLRLVLLKSDMLVFLKMVRGVPSNKREREVQTVPDQLHKAAVTFGFEALALRSRSPGLACMFPSKRAWQLICIKVYQC